MFNNPILHSMANIIRDYDDIREDRRQRQRRPRISFRPNLEDDADSEDKAPPTEIMRLWKARRWKELREALGAKAMIAGAAMVQIGHDPKTAKQKQKQKETAIGTERREAREKVAKCIRKRLSSLLYDFARAFAEMDGLDCPLEDEYDHDKNYYTFARIMGSNVAKFVLDESAYWSCPNHGQAPWTKSRSSSPATPTSSAPASSGSAPSIGAHEHDVHLALGQFVLRGHLLLQRILPGRLGLNRVCIQPPFQAETRRPTMFWEKRNDDAIRAYIAKNRGHQFFNEHGTCIPKHHVDIIFDCIEHALSARFDCWKLATDFWRMISRGARLDARAAPAT